MTKDELKTGFIHRNLDKGVIHCDETSVNNGLEMLEKQNMKAANIVLNFSFLNAAFRKIDKFNGFVQGGNLAEDNLFYDLDIPSCTTGTTEDFAKKLPTYLEEVRDLVEQLKKDITATKDAIAIYSNTTEVSAGELAKAADSISLFDDYARLNPANQTLQTQEVQKPSGGGKSRAISYSAPIKSEVTATPTNVEAKPVENTYSAPQTEEQKPQTVLKDTTTETNKNNNVDNKPQSETKVPENKPIDPNKDIKTDIDDIKADATKVISSQINSSGKNKNSSSLSGSIIGAVTPKGGEKLTEILDEEVKKATEVITGKGTLTSSIGTIKEPQETIKIDKLTNPNIETDQVKKSSFVPLAASTLAAGSAGIGTKIYMDKKEEKDEKKDFNEEPEIERLEEENDDIEPLSVEDKINAMINN